MRAHRITPAVLVAGSLMAGCSLLTSLDGFSGGGDAPGLLPDGGDAATEGAASPDAAADGGAPGCPLLGTCLDFDGVDPLSGWEVVADPGAATEVSGDRFVSAPKALRTSAGTKSAPRVAFVSRNLAATVAHARLSYALYIEKAPAAGEIELCILRFTGGGQRSEFYVGVAKAETNAVEQVVPGSGGGIDSEYHVVPSNLTAGEWHRVVLEVTLTGARRLVLSIDGAVAVSEPLRWAVPGVVSLHAGITYASEATSDATVWIDDLVFEPLP